MNTPAISHLILLFVSLVVALLLTSLPADAAEREAHTKSRQGAYSTSSGKSGTFERNTTRKKGNRSMETSVITQEGRTLTSKSAQTWDKATGTGTGMKTQTVAGPQGKSSERILTSSTHSDGTLTRTIETTGPDGRTTTRTETITGVKPKL